MKLEGKVAIVTGAGRGIGKAIALAFAQEGADVAVLSRSLDEVEETAKEVLQGNCSKFKKQTGWKLAIPFEKTMEGLLNYWRERV